MFDDYVELRLRNELGLYCVEWDVEPYCTYVKPLRYNTGV